MSLSTGVHGLRSMPGSCRSVRVSGYYCILIVVLSKSGAVQEVRLVSYLGTCPGRYVRMRKCTVPVDLGRMAGWQDVWAVS